MSQIIEIKVNKEIKVSRTIIKEKITCSHCNSSVLKQNLIKHQQSATCKKIQEALLTNSSPKKIIIPNAQSNDIFNMYHKKYGGFNSPNNARMGKCIGL